ncbi:MAG: hypothetical protein FD155_2464 [Bacteroidetes bacterium]|nr:MAG: hypothetical protein FD155_2464 [Bacteroidota bacterium]
MIMPRFFIVLAVLFSLLSCETKRSENKKQDSSPKLALSDDSLMTLVQYQTFQYFYEGSEPTSGLAPERIHPDGYYNENDAHIITTGGSGFGVMAILVGIERGFITREAGFKHLKKNVDWLAKVERYHGAWPHWIDGTTGIVKPFSTNDNGADIVETAFLIQGLLAARQYFLNGSIEEQQLAAKIDQLWREVEWSWFTKNGEDVLYWHWSPDNYWKMNVPVRGYNECLIAYVLAASSPTFPVSADVYHKGWAMEGEMKTNMGAYGYNLTLKHDRTEKFGGPLFWSHYSFLGLDPRNLSDQYADYWTHNVNHTLINRQWCIENPLDYKGYGENCWGLTASYSPDFYHAHAPGYETDKGVISPTAALSSFPYTPEYSLQAMKHFYYQLGDKVWGKYGFYDAFSEQENWFPEKYLAIDQGPIVVMIENHRSGLLWNLFMSSPDIQQGLTKLGFDYK